MKDKKITARNEFRDNFVTGGKPHTSYVYGKQGQYWLNIPITSEKKTRGKPNIEMTTNPNKGHKAKKGKSYFVPEARRTHKNKMSKYIRTDWTLDGNNAKLMQPYMAHEFDGKGKPKKS